MTLKTKITKKVCEILGKDTSDDNIKKIIPIWWFSTRSKSLGGLRLTDTGLDAFRQAEIKEYRIIFDDPISFSNQLIIWLDNFMDCPFYLKNKEIVVFSEKMAVQLVLFSGNIYRFSEAKALRQRS